MANTYRTSQGDTWDMVSFKIYGKEHYVHELMKANLEHRNVVIFPANYILSIPQIQAQSVSTLPPWKRGSV